MTAACLVDTKFPGAAATAGNARTSKLPSILGCVCAVPAFPTVRSHSTDRHHLETRINSHLTLVRITMDAACTQTYIAMRRLINAARSVAQRNAQTVVTVSLRFMWDNLCDLTCKVTTFSDGCVYVFPESSSRHRSQDWLAVLQKSHVTWMWLKTRADAKPVAMMSFFALPLLVGSHIITWPADAGTPPRSFNILSDKPNIVKDTTHPFVKRAPFNLLFEPSQVIGYPVADSAAWLFALAGIASASVDGIGLHRDNKYRSRIEAFDFCKRWNPNERMAAAVCELRKMASTPIYMTDCPGTGTMFL